MRIPPTLRRRPSPSMVVAMVALFVALSGVAFALPGRNTVDSGDIVDEEVKSRDVENNSLTGNDIGPDTIFGSDVFEQSLGEVPTANVTRALEPNAVTLRTQSVVVPGGDQADSNGNGVSRAVGVSCMNNEVAIGGGAFWSGNDNSNSNELENRLHTAAFNVNNNGVPTGYRARGEVDKDGDDTLTVQVVCAKVIFIG